MAMRSLKFCSWPGCNELTRARHCDAHARMYEQKQSERKAKYNKTRGGSSKAGYGSDWQRCRLMQLRAHPLCFMCYDEGKVVPATLVHHIKPIQDGGARLDPENLLSVCQFHHEEIHSEGRFKRKV